MLVIVYASHFQCSPKNFTLLEYALERKKIISAIVVFVALALFWKLILNKKNKEPQKIEYETLLPKIENIFTNLINMNREFDNSIDKHGKYTNTNRKPTTEEIEEIRKKINTAFDATIEEIENKKIEDKATFDSFLQELDNILNYLKSIETKIEKIWHNGKCEEYNQTFNNILNRTITNKLLECLTIKNTNEFNEDMFTTYVHFINTKNLTYAMHRDVNKRQNNIFYYYELLHTIWYDKKFLHQGNSNQTESNIKCLLTLPLAESLYEEAKESMGSLNDARNISFLILKKIAPNPQGVLSQEDRKILQKIKIDHDRCDEGTNEWFNKLN